jgi:hypothetical protein
MADGTRSSSTLAVATTLALIEQFSANLVHPQHDLSSPTANNPSPLLLLGASAKSLKAEVTKSSLLAVTNPFTPSALSSCLHSINDSILPSLTTAALLTSGGSYTVAFCEETRILVRGCLRELQSLAQLIEKRGKDGNPKIDLSESKKNEITEATGRVWEACDSIISFAEGGLPGFAVRKAKQWLALMKDAVKELQEWDPEEELDEDDLFGDTGSDSGSTAEETPRQDTQEDHRATISAGVKEQALKVLSRIPQSVHVVVKQRLEKLKGQDSQQLSASSKSRLEKVVVQTRTISELIDESAEGMYMGDLELCLKKAGEARATTIELVQTAMQPFSDHQPSSDGIHETPEDKYVKRALEWIQQVDTATALPNR